MRVVRPPSKVLNGAQRLMDDLDGRSATCSVALTRGFRGPTLYGGPIRWVHLGMQPTPVIPLNQEPVLEVEGTSTNRSDHTPVGLSQMLRVNHVRLVHQSHMNAILALIAVVIEDIIQRSALPGEGL